MSVFAGHSQILGHPYVLLLRGYRLVTPLVLFWRVAGPEASGNGCLHCHEHLTELVRVSFRGR